MIREELSVRDVTTDKKNTLSYIPTGKTKYNIY